MQSPKQTAAAPLQLLFEDQDARFRIILRVRAARELLSAPAHLAPQTRLLIGSGEDEPSGLHSCYIVDSEKVEVGPGGRLTEASRERISAWRPVRESRTWTVGLWVTGHEATARELIPLLIEAGGLLPDRLAVFVDDRSTVTAFTWTGSDRSMTQTALQFPASWQELQAKYYSPFDAQHVAAPPAAGQTQPAQAEFAVSPNALAGAANRGLVPDVAKPELRARVTPPPQPHAVLRHPERQTPMPRPAAQAVQEPQDATAGLVVQFEVPKWVWGCLFAISACALALWWWSIQPPPGAAQEQTGGPLGLQVARRDANIELRWNASASPIGLASGGSLRIADGGIETDVPMSAAHLREGQLVYLLRSAEARITLSVFTPNGTVQQSLRVVQAPDRALTAFTVTQGPQASGSGSAVRYRSLQPGSETPAEPPVTQRTTASFAPPKPSATPSPVLTAEAPRIVSSSGGPAMVVIPAASVPPPPTSTAPSHQLPPSPAPAVSDPKSFRPAVPLKKLTPALPAHLKHLVTTSITVPVTLSIDAEGNVSGAAVPERKGLEGTVAGYARQSASRWKFEPATLNGKAVPSQQVVNFVFAAR